ncbi:hypothetical protein TNCV_1516091 [Trichonephila clavipes]|nr:hypothetical protein TNCV_1516091 [Trichonephila clavipes]
MRKDAHKGEQSNPAGSPVSIGLTWEHDILVLKPFPCLHSGHEVDDWMGLNEWNSWFKSRPKLEQKPRYCEFKQI